MRYWPWIALAADLYRHERKTKADYGKQPKPTEVETLLSRIAAKAQTLRCDLMQLDELSRRLSEATAPLRREHLTWLYQSISQSLTANRVVEPSDRAEALLDWTGMFETWKRLELLEAAAKAALSRFDKSLLTGVRSQRDKGLIGLVSKSAEIWMKLTGKRPSVSESNRQASKGRKPPFVRFVTNIAGLVDDREPTLDQIATAFEHLQSRKK
jgi:hypothetical protein